MKLMRLPKFLRLPYPTKGGFSLIELLVVMTIIGTLMGLGTVAYSTAQKKARDSSREARIQAIANGLEQYFADNGSYDGGGGNCDAAFADTSIFPAGVPEDPISTNNFDVECLASEFTVCAEMESNVGNSDFDEDTDEYTFDNSGNETHYCLINQQ